MPANKLALLRYRIIDQSLQNTFKRWTLDDLIEEVSDALYEYEGITSGVSKRTIQLDIQNMRSDKLGYNAPIEVIDKKYYHYAETAYSITNSPLSGQDVDKLNEVVSLLKQFKEFSYFQDLSALITRLEDKVLSRESPQNSPIQFDKNKLLQGTQWLQPLHKAIVNCTCLDLFYQSFKADKPSILEIYPYLLKEYNNRWFLLAAVNTPKQIQIIALDRIRDFKENPLRPFKAAKGIDVYHYFDDCIGVSKTPKHKPIDIVLRIRHQEIPYLKTKPIHHSQQILEENEVYGIVKLTLIWNFELEREILGRGESVEVLSPPRLRRVIKYRLRRSRELYKD